MENRITAQIAAMYPKAGIEHISLGIVRMLAVNFEGETIKIIKDNGQPLWLESHKCKLILTPLSEITDEDAMNIADILCNTGINKRAAFVERKNIDRVSVWTGGYGICTIWNDGNISWHDADLDKTAKVLDIKKAYDYLRQHGYDCDNLLSNGLATFKN